MTTSHGTPTLSAVQGIACASFVDALGHFYDHRVHILDLVSPTPTRPLFGPAATIEFLPYRQDREEVNAAGFASWFYRAVGDEPAGKVLVMSSGGHPGVSHGGGTKLSRAHNNGLAGLLTDGRLRDFGQLADYSFSTWCGGEATRWGGDVVTPAAANVPVEIGGVCVLPGDYLYADSAGAVVIPAARVWEVIAEARKIEREEDGALVGIREEDPVSLRSTQSTHDER
ncbi:RraA family protein [Amycolatopsis sp. NPDC051903]|uniref:RraA family protein n=1 Tax=Amycolatopsis sp. NPDC051903 TaxID=3363936 RepID=UPI003787863D